MTTRLFHFAFVIRDGNKKKKKKNYARDENI